MPLALLGTGVTALLSSGLGAIIVSLFVGMAVRKVLLLAALATGVYYLSGVMVSQVEAQLAAVAVAAPTLTGLALHLLPENLGSAMQALTAIETAGWVYRWSVTFIMTRAANG